MISPPGIHPEANASHVMSECLTACTSLRISFTDPMADDDGQHLGQLFEGLGAVEHLSDKKGVKTIGHCQEHLDYQITFL